MSKKNKSKILKEKIVSFRVTTQDYKELMKLGYSPTKVSRAGFKSMLDLVRQSEKTGHSISEWKLER